MGVGCLLVGVIEMFVLIFCVLYFYNKVLLKIRPRFVCSVRRLDENSYLPGTHHLRVVGIEGLFIQGEFLRTEGAVELNHLRKLQAETKETVKNTII